MYEVTNDVAHVCALPDPASHPVGTDIECMAPRKDGLYADGRCGRKYTRYTRFWSRRPYWADYDYGW